jgi:putative endonuclease
MYKIYFLINEWKTKTYVGFTKDLNARIEMHKAGKIKTTESFGVFSVNILENIGTVEEAQKKEKYWKSCAGRKKLKRIFFT